MPGEVDDAGGDVHIHDPVHDLKTKKYSVAVRIRPEPGLFELG